MQITEQVDAGRMAQELFSPLFAGISGRAAVRAAGAPLPGAPGTRSQQDPASSEVEVGVGALLGMLAIPGAITCFIMVDKYSTFLNWYRGRLHQDLLLVSHSRQVHVPLAGDGHHRHRHGPQVGQDPARRAGPSEPRAPAGAAVHGIVRPMRLPSPSRWWCSRSTSTPSPASSSRLS